MMTYHADYLRLTHCSQGDLEMIFKGVIFLLIFQIDNLSNSYETAFRRMSQNPFQNKLTLVQVMALCQCWPRLMSPYGVIMPLLDPRLIAK